MLTFQQIQIISMLVDTRSFTKTAVKLGLSKSYISQAVSQLEEKLKIDLFVRTTRHVRPTDAGMAFLDQAQRLSQEYETTLAMITGFSERPSGHLRISANPYFANTILANFLRSFSVEYPDISFDILVEEKMPNMRQKNIDIVLGVNWPAPDDVVAKAIGKTRYVLAASPKYLLNYGKPESIKDLSEHYYIPHLGRQEDKPLIDLKQNTAVTFIKRLASNQASFIKQCALSDMGLVQLHDYMIAEELQSGQLIEVLPDCFNQSIPLYLYYQKHRYVQPKIRLFIDQIMKI